LFLFSLQHDLETSAPGGPYAVSPANYIKNLKYLWQRLADTGAKVIWRTTTPVLFQQTPAGCKYCRNESSVVHYNALALTALKDAATRTPDTPLRVNDVFADVTNFCGVNYPNCSLQLSHGVHFTQMGREYTGLSAATSILNALYGLGDEHNSSTIAITETATATTGDTADISTATSAATSTTAAVAAADDDDESPASLKFATSANEPNPMDPIPAPPRPPCGEPPTALDLSSPNVLLIGDSISMGYSFYEESPKKCTSPTDPCQPDNRLGYGLYVKEILANTTANWTLASVQVSNRVAQHWFLICHRVWFLICHRVLRFFFCLRCLLPLLFAVAFYRCPFPAIEPSFCLFCSTTAAGGLAARQATRRKV
jgi:hypothetical protein